MNASNHKNPLFVDLDGTLIRSDIFIESFFALLKKKLRYVFLSFQWLLKGKACFKHEVASRVDLDIPSLPFNKELLQYLNKEKGDGRKLYLATASNIKYAMQVAEHTGLFDGVLASDRDNNLSGEKKLRAIREQMHNQAFDYAGNNNIDLTIWKQADNAIIVSSRPELISAAANVSEIERVFNPGVSVRYHWKAIRPHQWVKNILIFLPLFAAHEMTNIALLMQGLIAFMAFSLCASSVYLLNDMLDLPADRKHPRKCNRPYAAGHASIIQGAILTPALLITAFSISLYLPLQFTAVLLVYYISTLLYSIKLKNIVMLDVLVLSGLYTLRIIAGSAAVNIEPSFWLLAFSMFIFLSLAMVKRYSELITVLNNGSKQVKGRGYLVKDLELLISLGGASGYMAVLVLALYINSPKVLETYSHAEIIWLLCPLLLYWISRVWLVTRRGMMHDDPVVFALRDKLSRVVLYIAIIILLVAR